MKRWPRNLIFPDANGFRISATTIGHVLAPEHQKIIDRARENLIRQYEERRKNEP